MLIELQGVEFVNKGAQLMLHAIIQKIKENNPKASFVMQPRMSVPVEKLTEYNIYVKKGKKAEVLPKFIRKCLKIAVDKDIEVILDGSGFAYGDRWGVQYAEQRIGSKIKNWQKDGKKVILLPQAFGPFTDKQLQETMKKVIAHADLIFAREKESYSYLRRISEKDNIVLAPDFTNHLVGKVPKNFNAAKYRVAIIPNHQMIYKSKDEGKAYYYFLHTAVTKVMRLGLKPYFLIHEGERDVQIAKKVNEQLAQPLDIVINPDPLIIKGIISTAFFIICSRFHGVVSALSQGVPCLTTSWSHKYEMLHQEYEFEEGLFSSLNNTEEIEEKIARLADPKNNKKISEKLLEISTKQKESTAKMWKQVFNVINKERN